MSAGKYIRTEDHKQKARNSMKRYFENGGISGLKGKSWKVKDTSKYKGSKKGRHFKIKDTSKMSQNNIRYWQDKKRSKKDRKKISISNIGKHDECEKQKSSSSYCKKRRTLKLHPMPEQCNICGIFWRDTKPFRKLCYDHDHNTEEFRGWLCMSCNLILGHAKDDIEILKKTISYLKKIKNKND